MKTEKRSWQWRNEGERENDKIENSREIDNDNEWRKHKMTIKF